MPRPDVARDREVVDVLAHLRSKRRRRGGDGRSMKALGRRGMVGRRGGRSAAATGGSRAAARRRPKDAAEKRPD